MRRVQRSVLNLICDASVTIVEGDRDIDYKEAWDSDGTVHKAYHSSRTVDIYS